MQAAGQEIDGSRPILDRLRQESTSVGRKRQTNRNLPQRVYVHRRWYRFVPKTGKPIRLAEIDDYAGMLRALADVLGTVPRTNTMTSLMDRYELEILPQKADSTQRDQRGQLVNLRRAFGHMAPVDIRQPDAIKYRNKRAEKAPTAANREMELLSHVCSMAVEWGAIDTNPLAGMRKIKRPPRDRYVTDEEFEHIRNLAPPMIQCVLDLAVLTGLRRADIFGLNKSDYSADGLYCEPGKNQHNTRVRLLFEPTEELVRVLENAVRLGPRTRITIVGNRMGKAYTKNGFDSVWSNLMDKATDITKSNHIDRFQFRDLRRKNASDEIDEFLAQKRLGHASVEITNRVYRVKPRLVRPLR